MAEDLEKYTVNITQNAENDLDEIISYISRNNPQTALKILKKLQDRIQTLDHFPYKGGYVPELLQKNIKVEDKIVNILTVIDSRRNIQDILIKKLVK